MVACSLLTNDIGTAGYNLRFERTRHESHVLSPSQAPQLYATFFVGSVGCFIAYFRYFYPFLHLYTHLHFVGFLSAVISVVTYIACTQVCSSKLTTQSVAECAISGLAESESYPIARSIRALSAQTTQMKSRG
jgi:hypothetical protein